MSTIPADITAHTNGALEDPEAAKRDIKDHMLFEVSTEAANRGASSQTLGPVGG